MSKFNQLIEIHYNFYEQYEEIFIFRNRKVTVFLKIINFMDMIC